VAARKTSDLELRRDGRTVRLSRFEMLFWPDKGIRKADLVGYYTRIAPVLLPHLRDRPFTLKRRYNGPRSPFEWIKDAPAEMPDWIPVAWLSTKSPGGEIVRYPLVNDELALLWMIEFGCVDLHVWTSRADLPERPGYVLFDLDPAGVPFADVVRAARLLHEALEALGLDGATVAAPLRWEELDEALDPRDLTMDVVPDRVERGGDPHEPLLSCRQRLETALAAFAP
jgi:bifunctional non-homologous end joining protein LigD